MTRQGEKEKIECIVDFLKTYSNTEDDVFNSVGLYFGHEDDCEESVKRNVDEVFNKTEVRIFNQIGQRQVTNCLINRLRNHEIYKTFILLSQVLNYSKISWKIWKYFDIRDRLDSITFGIKLIEEFEVTLCVSDSSEIDQSDDTDDYENEGSGAEDISIQNQSKEGVSDSGQNQHDDGFFFDYENK